MTAYALGSNIAYASYSSMVYADIADDVKRNLSEAFAADVDRKILRSLEPYELEAYRRRRAGLPAEPITPEPKKAPRPTGPVNFTTPFCPELELL